MKDTISLITLIWSIVRGLIKFYKHLEKKYGWGKNQGPQVRAEIRTQKKAQMDDKIKELFVKGGLPEPDRNMQAWIRERVHERIDPKQRRVRKLQGKASRRA